ncbi:hypothetical protein NKE62_11135 [Akkermansia sp. Marseille-P9185]|uniref:hypothetical protein n=1 Tax=Akkermansia massiliensis TaxID=2927224 RepID=UPI00209C5266|nr:hypothetical protein [Akkermansia massiliensis]MCO8187476.1 hypothetical protein [Akkermansia massiliensis]
MSNTSRIKIVSRTLTLTPGRTSKASRKGGKHDHPTPAACLYLPAYLRDMLAPLAARRGVSVEAYAAQVLNDATNRKGTSRHA